MRRVNMWGNRTKRDKPSVVDKVIEQLLVN
jgi:hypothetical protein